MRRRGTAAAEGNLTQSLDWGTWEYYQNYYYSPMVKGLPLSLIHWFGTALDLRFVRYNAHSIMTLFLTRLHIRISALFSCAVILNSKLSIVFFIRCLIIFFYLRFLTHEIHLPLSLVSTFMPAQENISEGLLLCPSRYYGIGWTQLYMDSEKETWLLSYWLKLLPPARIVEQHYTSESPD